MTDHFFTGVICKRKLGKGSKGDKIVNALLTPEGLDLIIRHESGTAYQDPEFDALEGKTVNIRGEMRSYVLIVEDCVVKEPIKTISVEGNTSVDLANGNNET